MKYMIIEVLERDIFQPIYFDTLKEAKATLKELSAEIKNVVFYGEDFGAYGETANHDNWVAEIFEVNPRY